MNKTPYFTNYLNRKFVFSTVQLFSDYLSIIFEFLCFFSRKTANLSLKLNLERLDLKCYMPMIELAHHNIQTETQQRLR